MFKILQAAGAPEKAVKMVQQVVDTCRPCRLWAKPGPISATTARLIEAFNELCQHDLMFVSPNPGDATVRAEPWQHIIDAATKLSQAAIVPNKSAAVLLASFDAIWVRPYGAPKILESDQESGLLADEVRVYLGRIGTEVRFKGVDAHAKMAEKHHDLLRHVWLRIRTQAQLEGLPVTNDHCLTAALTAKNSLFTIGDTSPQMAVFGRQSAILPNLEAAGVTLDDSHTGPDGISRGRHRMKEIAAQSMIEEQARLRMQIAARTKTRRAVEDADFKVGDQVEFHRRTQGKEVPGWRGPGEVLKIDRDGTTHIQWMGGTLNCRYQDVRRALTYFLFFMIYHFGAASNEIEAWEYAQNTVSRMTVGSQLHIGIVTNNGKKRLTKTSEGQPHLLHAILRAASCDLHLEGCVGARLIRGMTKLSGIAGYSDSLLVTWKHKQQDNIAYWRLPPDTPINFREFADDATQLCSIQFLLTDDDDVQQARLQLPHVPHLGGPQPADEIPAGMDATIPTQPPTMDIDHRGHKRGRDRADSGNPAPHVSPCHEPDENADKAQNIIERATQQSQQPEPQALDVPVPDDDEDDDLMDELHATTDQQPPMPDDTPLYPPEQIHLDHLQQSEPPPVDTFFAADGFTPYRDQDDDNVELYVDRVIAHWFLLCDRQLCEDEVLVFVANKHRVSAVIKRVFDNLTPEEVKEHWPEVEAAMFDELKRWHSLNTFRRFPKNKSTNPIDGTWVLKWKSIKGTNAKGEETNIRIVKARLTARGFKDLQAFENDVATFSGTASKASQRLVNGFAAQHEYVLFSMDISAAFLKGLTFDEISKLSGQPKRSVQFVPPKNCIHLIRRLPGLEDFDPSTELLDFLKAMWGLKDAPRLFGLRRDMSFRAFGAHKSQRDSNFWVKYHSTSTGRKVVALLSTHLDDIKGGATESERQKLQEILKKDFGDDLKINIGVFEFTGVKHIQDAKTKAIYTHQDHYIAELSVIPLPLSTPNPDDDADTDEAEAFVSLLGALAWLLITRADISPYVGYMQRLAGKPKKKHLKMCNQVLRYVKRNTTGLRYKKLMGNPYLLCVADSAYQANEDRTDCIALRGYFIFLACDSPGKPFPGGDLQLIDFVSKKLHVISRSAFAAELRNTLEAAQDLINTALQFHELYRGPFTASQCAELRDRAQHFLRTVICTDNHGLFTAVSKTEPSPGTDGSMVFHVKALREYLDNKNIDTVCWIDNRDMIADGLTKCKPNRALMNDVLTSGSWTLHHEVQTWQSDAPTHTTTNDTTNDTTDNT